MVETVIFGISHLFTTYAALFISLASGLARFDGRPTDVPLFVEHLLAVLGSVLLFPFGYLPVPLIGPWINSVFWSVALYYLLRTVQRRRERVQQKPNTSPS